MTLVTDTSTAIEPRRVAVLWRLLTARSTAASGLELLGAVLMLNGLRLIYPPAAWLFGGLACLAVAYLLELGAPHTSDDPSHTNVDPNHLSPTRSASS